MDLGPSIRKVPLLLNSVNIDGMLVKFLLKNDVDHRISSETFVYCPNRPFLFPFIIHSKLQGTSIASVIYQSLTTRRD